MKQRNIMVARNCRITRMVSVPASEDDVLGEGTVSVVISMVLLAT